METQIWCHCTALHCGSVYGRGKKRYNGHLLQFCLGGSCPPALALMPDTSIPPHMPLVFFKVLPWWWGPEGVSQRKSIFRALQEERSENPTISSADPCPLVFIAQLYGDFSSWHWNPGLVGLVWGWDPSLPRYSSILYSPLVGLGSAGSMSHISTLLPLLLI